LFSDASKLHSSFIELIFSFRKQRKHKELNCREIAKRGVGTKKTGMQLALSKTLIHLKMTVFWGVAPDNLAIVLKMEAANICETSVDFYQTTALQSGRQPFSCSPCLIGCV
jgi:hypothetical protein